MEPAYNFQNSKIKSIKLNILTYVSTKLTFFIKNGSISATITKKEPAIIMLHVCRRSKSFRSWKHMNSVVCSAFASHPQLRTMLSSLIFTIRCRILYSQSHSGHIGSSLNQVDSILISMCWHPLFCKDDANRPGLMYMKWPGEPGPTSKTANCGVYGVFGGEGGSHKKVIVNSTRLVPSGTTTDKQRMFLDFKSNWIDDHHKRPEPHRLYGTEGWSLPAT